MAQPPTELDTNQDPIRKGQGRLRASLAAAKAVLSKIQRFFLFLSKTDTDILEHCGSWARMHQASMGFVILLMGIIAFCALSYGAYVVFESLFVAIVCGLLYACIVMWFDREVVSCFSNAQVWLRVPIAILFGLIAAIPVDLRIFEGRIEEEILRTDRIKNAAFHAEAERIRQQALERIALHDGRISRTDADRKRLSERLDALHAEFSELHRKADTARELMVGEEYGREGSGLSGIEGRGRNHAYHLSILTGVETRLRGVTAEREAVQQELRRLRQRSENLLRERDVQAVRVESEREVALARAREELYTDGPRDLLSRFEALLRVVSASPAARVLVSLWTALFFVVELLPAIAKLFLRKTEYHGILEAEEVKNGARIIALTNQAVAQIHQHPSEPEFPTLEDHLRETPLRWGNEPRESARRRLRVQGTSR